jgi:hypothetical protein
MLWFFFAAGWALKPLLADGPNAGAPANPSPRRSVGGSLARRARPVPSPFLGSFQPPQAAARLPPPQTLAAGYYTTNSTSGFVAAVGITCIPCGADAWCPGARASAVSSRVRNPCGAFTSTFGVEYATNVDQCKVLPGYGFGAGDTSSICPQGF